MSRPLVVCALATLTVLAYLPALDNGFVNYDDDLYITNAPHVRAGLDADGVAWAFTSFHGANWFPLTRLSWMLDAELSGLDPSAFHRTDVLLHTASTLLLFLALLRMTGALGCSAFVAAVFGVHPLHVESVAWASARKDVVSGLFFMLALWIYAGVPRGRDARGAEIWRIAAVTGCLALGLMAKQTLVTLPFLLLLLDEWPLARLRGPDGRWDVRRVRRAVVEKIPLFAVAIAGAIVAVLAQRSWGTVQTFEALPLATRVANAFTATLHYVGDAFWPVGLAPFYPHPGVGLRPAPVLGAAAALAAISVAAGVGLRRWPPLAIGWFWFLVALLPVSGLMQVGQAERADRYMYLPLIGLSIPVAWGLGALAARGAAARAAALVTGVATTLGLAVATHAQASRWRDSITLFQHALEVTHGNHVAHMNLGLALQQAGRLGDASPHLVEAVRLAPESPMAHGLLGELRLAQERWREAESELREALAGQRDSPRWQAGIGAALLGEGRIDEAVDHLGRAVEGRPATASLRVNLAVAQARAGDLEAAVASLRSAIEIDPNLAVAHLQLGLALAELGRWGESAAALSRALALDPGLTRAHAALAQALAARGDRGAALSEVEAALGGDPDSGALAALHGRLLEASGRIPEAVAAYRRALALGERPPELLNNLAWLLASGAAPLEDPGEAVRLAEEAAEVSQRRAPAILDTLAAAYAAAGRPAEARVVTREALALVDADGDGALAEGLRRRLATLEGETP